MTSKIPELPDEYAPYERRALVLLRLLRFKGGQFTSSQFDDWFRPMRSTRFLCLRLDFDTPILGMGINGGTYWAEMLELLQILVRIGLVNVKKIGGVYEYRLVS